jgi:hypothetical protein
MSGYSSKRDDSSIFKNRQIIGYGVDVSVMIKWHKLKINIHSISDNIPPSRYGPQTPWFHHCEWIENHSTGKWCTGDDNMNIWDIYFEKENDAVLYKLTWL